MFAKAIDALSLLYRYENEGSLIFIALVAIQPFVRRLLISLNTVQSSTLLRSLKRLLFGQLSINPTIKAMMSYPCQFYQCIHCAVTKHADYITRSLAVNGFWHAALWAFILSSIRGDYDFIS